MVKNPNEAKHRIAQVVDILARAAERAETERPGTGTVTLTMPMVHEMISDLGLVAVYVGQEYGKASVQPADPIDFHDEGEPEGTK